MHRKGGVPPRWLADEMVGRLARYLRFSGCDTLYARGLSDDRIREIAREEGRVLLSRDRELVRRTPNAFLLTSPVLKEQWTAVARAYPGLLRDVELTRCTLCNGRLALTQATPEERSLPGVPWTRIDAGLPLYRCPDCGHLFWEGSHADRVRQQLRAWARELDG